MEYAKTSRSPTTQPFYRHLATVMTLLGLGDRTWWGYEAPNRFVLLHQKLIFVYVQMTFASETIYLIRYYNTLSFSTLRVIFLILPLDCITSICMRSAQMDSFKKIMEIFINKIHLFNYDDNFAEKKAVTADRYIRIAAYFLTICMMVDCVLWFLTPILHLTENIEEIRNETVKLETVLHVWMPYNYEYNIRNWAITHVINIYLGFIGCSIIIVYNTLNYTFMFHLIGHVQVLKHRFRTEFSTPLSDSDTNHKLISLIKHHSFITRIFKVTQKAFGYNVTANYCHNLLCDSLLMYEIMVGEKKNTLRYGLMFLVFMGGLILMSLVLEEMRRESDDLADVMYSIPWEKMSIPNQKTFMMILARAQPPLEFISAGGLRAGVRPAISIIKSTFSYYVMLKSTMRVDK